MQTSVRNIATDEIGIQVDSQSRDPQIIYKNIDGGVTTEVRDLEYKKSAKKKEKNLKL